MMKPLIKFTRRSFVVLATLTGFSGAIPAVSQTPEERDAAARNKLFAGVTMGISRELRTRIASLLRMSEDSYYISVPINAGVQSLEEYSGGRRSRSWEIYPICPIFDDICIAEHRRYNLRYVVIYERARDRLFVGYRSDGASATWCREAPRRVCGVSSSTGRWYLDALRESPIAASDFAQFGVAHASRREDSDAVVSRCIRISEDDVYLRNICNEHLFLAVDNCRSFWYEGPFTLLAGTSKWAPRSGNCRFFALTERQL
ncbi:MAG TPA: hypothetical protein VF092_18720 [Longimicrobium sp.]